jgi:hypothetical protein
MSNNENSQTQSPNKDYYDSKDEYRNLNLTQVSDYQEDDDNWEHYSDNESFDEEKPEKVIKSMDNVYKNQNMARKSFPKPSGFKKPYHSNYK